MIRKIFVILFFLVISVRPVFALDVDDYFASANIKGLSGSYFVDSTQTLLKGEIHAGLYGTAFVNDDQNFKKGTAEAVLSAGLLDGLEAAIVLPYIRQSGPISGVGDVQVSGKARLLDKIGNDIPSLALALSVDLPTGDKNSGFRAVNSYGATLQLVAEGKIDLEDYSFTLSAEGGVYAQDIGQNSEEKHIQFGGGGFFPLAPSWALLLEGTGTSKSGVDQDFGIVSASLRYFSSRFQLTGGADRTIPFGANAPPTGTALHGSISLLF